MVFAPELALLAEAVARQRHGGAGRDGEKGRRGTNGGWTLAPDQSLSGFSARSPGPVAIRLVRSSRTATGPRLLIAAQQQHNNALMGIPGLWDLLVPAAARSCAPPPSPLPPLPLTVALVGLAAEQLARAGRPLVVAVDASIWAFQVQAGREGANPVLRTFYYRLCRLCALPVRALFVFDGPNKPPFKRNERKGLVPETAETRLIRALIRAFGFEVWTAPGEAEAECARLQSRGDVDLVVTEDVDALMFGAGAVVREVVGKDRNAVMVYRGLECLGLDNDALVLVAMMAGGDYLPSGLFGFGPKVAVEVPMSPLSGGC